MAGRQDEAVSVGPGGVRGVVVHDPCPEDVGQRGQGHRCSLVSRPGGMGPVHSQAAYDGDGQPFEVSVDHGSSLSRRGRAWQGHHIRAHLGDRGTNSKWHLWSGGLTEVTVSTEAPPRPLGLDPLIRSRPLSEPQGV